MSRNAGELLIVVDYGLGNLASVANALERLAIPFAVSGDPEQVRKARAIILPGVGAAGQGMENLKRRGLDAALAEAVQDGMPFLGICLGMQLLLTSSEEGSATCLGLVPGTVKKFPPGLKVPQVGWNQVAAQPDSKLLKGLADNSYFYFVHSYYCKPEDDVVIAGRTEYGREFCSVIEAGNIFATQFHPEKSGSAGQQVLRNFWEVVCS